MLKLTKFTIVKTCRVSVIAALQMILASCITVPSEDDRSIDAFVSDRCSYYAEGTIAQNNLWCHCCVEHDLYYWMGGSETQRRDADAVFSRCIAETGASANAAIMWFGVRIAGGPNTKASYRWGFGWPYHSPYRVLNEEEQGMLAEQLLNLPVQVVKYCGEPSVPITGKGMPDAKSTSDSKARSMWR